MQGPRFAKHGLQIENKQFSVIGSQRNGPATVPTCFNGNQDGKPLPQIAYGFPKPISAAGSFGRLLPERVIAVKPREVSTDAAILSLPL
jgi:hypothetical protein